MVVSLRKLRKEAMTKVILGNKGQRPYRMPTETEAMILTWDTAANVKAYLGVNSQYCDDLEVWLDSQTPELAEFLAANPMKIPKRIVVMNTVQMENRYKIEAAIRDKIYGMKPEIEYISNVVPTFPIQTPIQQTIGDFTNVVCSGCQNKMAHNQKHAATLVKYGPDHKYDVHELCEFCFSYVERISIRPPRGERTQWCIGSDWGYANSGIRRAAKNLHEAISFLCYGKRGKGAWHRLPKTHPIIKALALLAKADKETVEYANNMHDPTLFEAILPDKKDCHP
jgi:hypothetical protein